MCRYVFIQSTVASSFVEILVFSKHCQCKKSSFCCLSLRFRIVCVYVCVCERFNRNKFRCQAAALTVYTFVLCTFRDCVFCILFSIYLSSFVYLTCKWIVQFESPNDIDIWILSRAPQSIKYQRFIWAFYLSILFVYAIYKRPKIHKFEIRWESLR